MRQLFATATLLAFIIIPQVAEAGPKIIATNVRAKCAIQPDGSLTTTLVTLNSVTHAHFGTNLSYTFTPIATGGTLVTLPTPPANPNPVPFTVLPGIYKLRISGLGAYSAYYNVTVPLYVIITTAGNHKTCIAIDPRQNPSLPRN